MCYASAIKPAGQRRRNTHNTRNTCVRTGCHLGDAVGICESIQIHPRLVVVDAELVDDICGAGVVRRGTAIDDRQHLESPIAPPLGVASILSLGGSFG